MRTLRWTGALSIVALAGGAAAVWLGLRVVGSALNHAFDIADERE